MRQEYIAKKRANLESEEMTREVVYLKTERIRLVSRNTQAEEALLRIIALESSRDPLDKRLKEAVLWAKKALLKPDEILQIQAIDPIPVKV